MRYIFPQTFFISFIFRIIAMGLEDFSNCEIKYELIQQHLLPGKSVSQIKCRVKNQVAKKEDNVIKVRKIHSVT